MRIASRRHRRRPDGAAAVADEKPVQLKQGAGLDKVEGNCSGCHSLDYVPMNSPFLNAGRLGCRGRQDDQRLRGSDRPSRRQGHRRLSQEQLRHVRRRRETRAPLIPAKAEIQFFFARWLKSSASGASAILAR